MMKVSGLVVLSVLLLELTTGQAADLATSSPMDIARNGSRKKASLLNPALEGMGVPMPPSEDPVEDPQEPHEFEDEISLQSRQREMSLYRYPSHGNLKWERWKGYLPYGAVRVGRQYVCQINCHSGYHERRKGRKCFIPYAGREWYGYSFKILVNKNKIENLRWRSGSYGRVPANSVKTCKGRSIYVAYKYGLGKVHARHRAFFLPYMGHEFWFKHYKVLTVKTVGICKTHMSQVRYNTNQVKISREEPYTLRIAKTTNNACRTAMKSVSISKTTGARTTWNIGSSLKFGGKVEITAQKPGIASGTFSFSFEKTFTTSKETSVYETHSHEVNVEVKVPPNHSCNVRMLGLKMSGIIPYTARLTLTYCNGRKRSRSISGKVYVARVGEIRTEIGRCQPVTHATPCPSK